MDLSNLTLPELEAEYRKVQGATNLAPAKRSARLKEVKHALRERKHYLKGEVASFEVANYQYLLFFCSTDGYYKIIGHSLLLYAGTVAPRLSRKANIREDTDHYYPSAEGVASVRDLEFLTNQLANLGILLDRDRSTEELFYFKLRRTYSPAQLEKLRDHSDLNRKRLRGILRPDGPLPELSVKLNTLHRLALNLVRATTDPLARQKAQTGLLDNVELMLLHYHSYAGGRDDLEVRYLEQPLPLELPASETPRSFRAKVLANLAARAALLHDRATTMESLPGMSQARLIEILTTNAEAQRLVAQAYRKLPAHERSQEA